MTTFIGIGLVVLCILYIIMKTQAKIFKWLLTLIILALLIGGYIVYKNLF